MYSFIRSLVKETPHSKWKELDVRAAVIRDLYKKYHAVVFELKDQSGIRGYFDLSKLQYQFQFSDYYVYDWLNFTRSGELPLTIKDPTLVKGFVKYRDAFQAGYTVEPVGPLIAVGSKRPIDDLPDAVLSKTGVDPLFMYHNCLFTVNGLFHSTDADVKGVYIKDACKSASIARLAQIGIHSYREVGSLTYKPFVRGMDYKIVPEQRYSEQMHVDLGTPLDGKSLLISIGGYLHLFDDLYTVVSDTCVRINFNKWPILERLNQMRQLIDISHLNLTNASTNDTQYVVEELFADEFWLRLMELSQSFFILVDTPKMFVEYIPVAGTGTPAKWSWPTRPDMPLQAEYGQYCDYVSGKDGKAWLLSGIALPRTNLQTDYYEWKQQLSVDCSRDPYNLGEEPKARLVHIGVDV